MDNPYRVFGSPVPEMLGREKDWKKTLLELKKPTPNNFAISGPKYIGKTVLLRRVYEHFQQEGQPFAACLYWDMDGGPFESDQDFFAGLADALADVLRGVDALAADTAATKSPTAYEAVREVGGYLQSGSQKLLLVLDHFDQLPSSPGLTQNVYASLRKLAELHSLCFVIASRRDLEDYEGDIKYSGLPNVFRKRSMLRALADEDVQAAAAPLQARGVAFGDGALTVLHKETGGIPILLMCVCSHIWEKADAGTSAIDRRDVEQIVEQQSSELERYLKRLWRGCTEKERLDLSRLADGQTLTKGESIYGPHADALAVQGFVEVTGRRVQMQCRLMERYAKEHRETPALLHQLFGDEERYEDNIKGVLEHRLAQIRNPDPTIYDAITMALGADRPTSMLTPLRTIANRGLDLVLKEACPDGQIPDAWVREWQWQEEKTGRSINFPRGPVPGEAFEQVRLVRLATDTRNSIQLPISRATAELLQALHYMGNFGQHLDGETVPSSFAAAICLNAIELCARLAQELPAHEAMAAM